MHCKVAKHVKRLENDWKNESNEITGSVPSQLSYVIPFSLSDSMRKEQLLSNRTWLFLFSTLRLVFMICYLGPNIIFQDHHQDQKNYPHTWKTLRILPYPSTLTSNSTQWWRIQRSKIILLYSRHSTTQHSLLRQHFDFPELETNHTLYSSINRASISVQAYWLNIRAYWLNANV